MIRKVTGERLAALCAGHCPHCAGEWWQPGPIGGLAQNYECADCGQRFNLTLADGAIAFAQAIGMRPFVDDWDRYRRAHGLRRLF